MARVLSFEEFINETSLSISNPDNAGTELSSILGKTRNVREVPLKSNSGPEVEKYLASVGLGKGNPWCQAYVYWVLDELSKKLGTKNPAPKVGTVKGHWDSAPAENKLTIDKVRSNPELIRPGMVFVMWRDKSWASGGTLGHTGIVIKANPADKTFTAIEGNTDEKATGEGDKVGINTRSLSDTHLVGFIDWFAGQRTPGFEKAIAGEAVKPALVDDKGGKITASYLDPNNKTPTNATAGDETEARAKDAEIDNSLLGVLLGGRKTGDVVTRGEIKKFLSGKSYSEIAQDAKPKES